MEYVEVDTEGVYLPAPGWNVVPHADSTRTYNLPLLSIKTMQCTADAASILHGSFQSLFLAHALDMPILLLSQPTSTNLHNCFCMHACMSMYAPPSKHAYTHPTSYHLISPHLAHPPGYPRITKNCRSLQRSSPHQFHHPSTDLLAGALEAFQKPAASAPFPPSLRRIGHLAFRKKKKEIF